MSWCDKCKLGEFQEELGRPQETGMVQLTQAASTTALLVVVPAPALAADDGDARLRVVRSFINTHIHKADELNVYAAYAVCCNYPEGTNINKKCAEACSIHLHENIRQLSEEYDLTIITCGKEPIMGLKKLGFRFNDVTNTNLSFNRLQAHYKNPFDIPVFCCGTINAKSSGGVDEKAFEIDADYINRYLDNEVTEDKLRWITVRTNNDCKNLAKYIGKLIAKSEDGTIECAIDTETTGLNMYSAKFPIDLVTVQISFGGGFGFVIPYLHKEADESTFKARKKIIEYILKDKRIKLIMHNSMYDWRVFTTMGFEVNSFEWDTIIMHSLVDSTDVHGLSWLSKKYTNYGSYDAALEQYKADHPEADPKKGGNYGNIPLNILAEYGVGDCIVTYDICQIFKSLLATNDMLDFYTDHVHVGQMAYLDMSDTGMRICPDKLRHYYAEYKLRIEEFLEKEILSLPIVKSYEEQFEDNIEYFQYIADPIAYKKTNSRKRKMPEYKHFNPNSAKQLGELLVDWCAIPVLKMNKSKSAPCFDKDVREYFARFDRLNNPWGVDLGIMLGIDKYKKMTKEYSTYIAPFYEKGMLCALSRVHASFNLYSTKTGRSSSSDPNMQNIPRAGQIEGFKIKELFTPEHGLLIMQADYSQAELRVIASLADDEAMLEAFNSGVDLHKSTASMVFGIPIDEISGEQRQVAKAINFGLVYCKNAVGFALDFYNALDADESVAATMYESLAEQGYPVDLESILKRKPKMNGMDVTLPDIFYKLAIAAVNKYKATYKGITAWIDEQQEMAKSNAYTMSIFGRLEALPDVDSSNYMKKEEALRQAVNMPVQSAASDITLGSIGRLHKWVKEMKINCPDAKLRMVNSVHDSIVFEIAPEYVDACVVEIKKIMEDTSHLSWLKCAMKVDFEVGESYGKLTEI